uniref:Uncharacterized protein n=1 Tax=Peronospora matthiolae TaxID=2874970 RepID=A0AAV1TSX1_9STRA
MLQGCRLVDKNNRHAVMIEDDVVMYVQIKQNVRVVDRGHVEQRASGLKDVIMHAIVESQPREATAQTGSLMSFHRRFGHLYYEDIERLVANPANGLELTDKSKSAQSKSAQSNSAQPKKDSGLNATLDVVGGVICSDLKGPITPMDKRKNGHLNNFIDHKSNYVRVFVAKSKDEVARKFQHIKVF